VRLVDLSEYNPLVEEYRYDTYAHNYYWSGSDMACFLVSRTGRLVATMFYYFAMGVASRSAKP
jgi:hypothetical protein